MCLNTWFPVPGTVGESYGPFRTTMDPKEQAVACDSFGKPLPPKIFTLQFIIVVKSQL